MNVILKNNDLEISNQDLTLVIKNVTTVQLEYRYSLLKNNKLVLTGLCKLNSIFGNLKPLTVNDAHVINLNVLSQAIKKLEPMFDAISKSNAFQDRYLLALTA